MPALDAQSQGSAVPGGGGETQALIGGGGGSCGEGSMCYTATRFHYASNGRAVTFVHEESWREDESLSGCNQVVDYTVTWPREFRYDGARARYMNRFQAVDMGVYECHLSTEGIWPP